MAIDTTDTLVSLLQFPVDRYASLSEIGAASSATDGVLDEYANLGLLTKPPMEKDFDIEVNWTAEH